MDVELDGAAESRVKTRDELVPAYVLAVAGFSCHLGWGLSLVFAPSLPLLVFYGIEEAIGLRCMFVLTLVAAFSLFAWKSDWFFEDRDKLLAVGLVVNLLLLAFTFTSASFGPFSLLVSMVAWGAAGVAQAIVATYWCTFFSLVKTMRTMLNITLGGVGGTVLFVIANAAGVLWVSLLEMLLLVLCSSCTVFYLSRGIPSENIPDIREFHRVPDLSVPAFFSVASCGVVYGFMTIEVSCLGPVAALIGGASGLFGVLLALAWCALGSKVDIDIGIVQRIVLPLLVASTLLLPVFQGYARVVCACLALAALAHSEIFNWYSVSIDNYEFRLHPVRRFALRQVPAWAGFFAGCIFAYCLVFVFHAEGSAFSLAMAALAIAVVVAFSVYGGDESKTKARFNDLIGVAEKTAASFVQPEARYESRFRRQCAEVVEQHFLTPREAEVFALLAKGRNAEYIANQLVVSPATVKSHIYHIYQKLGVNSQQRLMDLVDERGVD